MYELVIADDDGGIQIRIYDIVLHAIRNTMVSREEGTDLLKKI